MRVVVSLLLILGSLEGATASAQPPADDSWVAIAHAKDVGLVLATRAMRRYASPLLKGEPYRFRAVPLSRSADLRGYSLSADGTCLILDLPEGRRHIDLTRRVVDGMVAPQVEQGCRAAQATGALEDSKLSALARAHLAARFLRPATGITLDPTWQIYRPEAPDHTLYAPSFVLAESEPVHPTDVRVWSDLTAGLTPSGTPSQATRTELYRRFQALSPPCSIYWRRRSLPGSWLIEYWLYYPFDYGFGGHLHDSEHLFVEVDRLGGAVRRVAGAGHGMWAANNIFHTFAADGPPVALPLHALVEFGKHATAPDINRDGVFTPGFDSNIQWDASKVWGIRDATGSTDSSLRQFEGVMTVPRRPGRRRILVPAQALAERTAGLGDRLQTDVVEPCTYLETQQVEDGGETGQVAGADACQTNQMTAACARRKVLDNFDFKHEHAILKPSAFPRRFVRAGYGVSTFRTEDIVKVGWRGHMVLGVGAELAPLPVIKKFPVPGRLYVEGRAFSDAAGAWSLPQAWSVTYERLGTNLFGYYAGYARGKRRMERASDGDKAENVVMAGLVAEIALPVAWPDGWGSGVNVFLRSGINADGKTGIGWDLRLGLGWAFGSQLRKFGIRHGDESPY